MSQKVSKGRVECVDFLDKVKRSRRPTDLQLASFDWILYVLMTFGSCGSIPGKKKKLQLGWALPELHMLAPRMDFRAGCKQCQVNTTWEETAARRRLKGIPFCVNLVVLCLGLKSSNDLSKVTLALWWPLVRSEKGRNGHQWTLNSEYINIEREGRKKQYCCLFFSKKRTVSLKCFYFFQSVRDPFLVTHPNLLRKCLTMTLVFELYVSFDSQTLGK